MGQRVRYPLGWSGVGTGLPSGGLVSAPTQAALPADGPTGRVCSNLNADTSTLQNFGHMLPAPAFLRLKGWQSFRPPAGGPAPSNASRPKTRSACTFRENPRHTRRECCGRERLEFSRFLRVALRKPCPGLTCSSRSCRRCRRSGPTAPEGGERRAQRAGHAPATRAKTSLLTSC